MAALKANIVNLAVIMLVMNVLLSGVLTMAMTPAPQTLGTPVEGIIWQRGNMEPAVRRLLNEEPEQFKDVFKQENEDSNAFDEVQRRIDVPGIVVFMGTMFGILIAGWAEVLVILFGLTSVIGWMGALIATMIYIPIVYSVLKFVLGRRVSN